MIHAQKFTENILFETSSLRDEGSKLVRCRSASNMKFEQLSKHEENSFIEDAEANEAILRNTVSKEELCRYLSPLKFLEIDTWRKEVPYGEAVDNASNEHRKWRTPIEILLPTVGTDDDNSVSTPENGREQQSTKTTIAGSKFRNMHTQSQTKRTFEDVQRQNAQVLKRSNSDATAGRLSSDPIRPRIREIQSAREKTKQDSLPIQNHKNSAHGERLFAAYASANENAPKNDLTKFRKDSGKIYINQNQPSLTRDAVMTSYFAPGRPVTCSKVQSRRRSDPFKTNLRLKGAIASAGPFRNSPALPQSASPTRKAQPLTPSTNSPASPTSSPKISSSSWPAISGEEQKPENKADPEASSEVQIIPLISDRPRTSYDEDKRLPLYENHQSRHPAFKGGNRSLNRGWRSWNNRQALESRLQAASRIYQPGNSVQRKNKTVEIFTPSENRGNLRPGTSQSFKTAGAASKILADDETGSKNLPNTSLLRAREGSGQSRGEYVSTISYSLSNGQGNEIKAYRIVDDHAAVKTTNLKPMTSKTSLRQANVTPSNADRNFSKDANNNGTDARDGELGPVTKHHTPTSPWVSEVFSSSWAENEGYYVRKPRVANKTVTFRLGTANGRNHNTVSGHFGHMNSKVDVIRTPSSGYQSDLQSKDSSNPCKLSNGQAEKAHPFFTNKEIVPGHRKLSARRSSVPDIYERTYQLNPHVGLERWSQPKFHTGIRFASAVNSVTT